MPRPDAECDVNDLDDGVHLIPLHDAGIFINAERSEKVEKSRDEVFLTLRQRRQIKLGIRKVCVYSRVVYFCLVERLRNFTVFRCSLNR